ncbi:MAG: serine protease [Bacteroidetes bacterium]|nr:serine protease [Bacteroidota bacterium]
MKKFSLVLIASILGSALTIGIFKFFEIDDSKLLKIEHITDSPVVGAAYTINKKGEIVPLQFTDVAKKVMPAVVNIKSTQLYRVSNSGQQDPFRRFFDDDIFKHFFGPDFRPESQQPRQRGPQARIGTGSGVIINSDGYIVTNNHVIHNADDIEVTLDDNRVFKAKVIGTDPSTDLALIQIKETDLPYVPLVNSDEVEVGEWVLAIGNPFNLNSTVTAGIVSAKGRNINILQDRSAIESFIQTDAAINPGNSGGALVNLEGGLIGINTAIASPTGSYAGYGFAVPANIVSKVVEDLLKYGMVQRGYLGIIIRDVDGNLAKEKDLKLTEGVYVDSITANSAAGEVGVKENDVITHINDIEVKATAKLLETIGRHRPGDEVLLKINRDGKEKEFIVKLRNQEGKAKFGEKGPEDILEVLGVELEEIDKELSRKLDIEGGVRISKLSAGKLSRQTNIKEGFIITKVDGQKVKTIEKFTDILKDIKGGVMIEGIYEDYPGSYYYAFGL